jgi:hypothetical protein
MVVLRHSVDRARVEEVYRGDLAEIGRDLDNARRNSRNLHFLAGTAGRLCLFGSVVAPDSMASAQGVILGAQANAAMLVFSRIEDPPRHMRLGDGPPVTYLEPANPAHLIEWVSAYRLSAISRQADLLAMLDSLSTNSLRLSSSNLEWSIQYVEFFRAVLGTAKPTRTKAFRYIADYFAGCTGRSDQHKAARLVAIPKLEVVRALESSDVNKFEAALVEACQNHAKYYSSTEKQRKMPEGFVSLDLTMLAALAYDRGLKFDANVSEYVPAAWVRGEIFREISRGHG